MRQAPTPDGSCLTHSSSSAASSIHTDEMGFFDDSDEEDTKPRALLTLESFLAPEEPSDSNPSKDKENHDEDDPLDAYMKGLGNESKNAGGAVKRMMMGVRMEEEEPESDDATGHARAGGELHQCLESAGTDLDEESKRFNNRQMKSQEARSALDTTFLRESEKMPSLHATSIASYETATDPFCKVFWTPKTTSLGNEWRKDHDVRCTISIDPIVKFEELRELFGEDLLETIKQKGYEQPTLVQAQSLPVSLAGHDTLVTAATGQGKTLAYLWPLIVHIVDQRHLAEGETGPIALVLVPTRELAQQVVLHAKVMLKPSGGTAKAVIGGQGKYILQQELKRSGGVELVVATPGRLLDVLSDKKGLSLQRVTAVVLDEADKMLQMGFEQQVRQILSATRRDRQTFMLSATMGKRVEKVATEWLSSDYVRISVGRTGESSHHVEQHVIVLNDDRMKENFLLELLPSLQEVGRTLVFVATREGCERLALRVEKELPSVPVATLHGDKHQSDRTASLRAFAKGACSTLIATDVAGRGLDVPDVATVINFDQAKNLDTHQHRVGRTGRLSNVSGQKTGSAYTLLTPKNADFALVLKKSFEREHRPVSTELADLANKSRKSVCVQSSTKSGIRKGSGWGGGISEADSENRSVGSAPQPKRSRWS